MDLAQPQPCSVIQQLTSPVPDPLAEFFVTQKTELSECGPGQNASTDTLLYDYTTLRAIDKLYLIYEAFLE